MASLTVRTFNSCHLQLNPLLPGWSGICIRMSWGSTSKCSCISRNPPRPMEPELLWWEQGEIRDHLCPLQVCLGRASYGHSLLEFHDWQHFWKKIYPTFTKIDWKSWLFLVLAIYFQVLENKFLKNLTLCGPNKMRSELDLVHEVPVANPR